MLMRKSLTRKAILISQFIVLTFAVSGQSNSQETIDIDLSQNQLMIVKSRALRVRSGPGLRFDPVGKVNKYDFVLVDTTVASFANGWAKIEFVIGPNINKSLEGYVASEYLANQLSQNLFEGGRNKFYSKYSEQPNEILKSKVFRKCNMWTMYAGYMLGWRISEWRAKVSSISTTHGGSEASLTLESKAFGIPVHYGTVSSSIKMGTKVYEQLSYMKEREQVYFSCDLFSDEEKGINEISWTESGSLRNPEFKVRFTNITKK